ncbi:MAG TPA: metalloregulator ArsR/SmtB family transcription factor [Anaerolineaceae bacterium]|nr:metalloregulator ArsR/SmtB family transcription factor [Anaerolineaceae bacterium]HQL91830.1 metalloregulator ArsR/SmtB family transcription factor [Anaerolineaceae bacterium]
MKTETPNKPINHLPPDDENIKRMAETFKGLADPTRLKLIDLLLKGERCVNDLAEATQTSQSAVSHQLRLLRNLRFVSSRRDGQQVFYRINDEHIGELFKLALDHALHMHERI